MFERRACCCWGNQSVQKNDILMKFYWCIMCASENASTSPSCIMQNVATWDVQNFEFNSPCLPHFEWGKLKEANDASTLTSAFEELCHRQMDVRRQLSYWAFIGSFFVPIECQSSQSNQLEDLLMSRWHWHSASYIINFDTGWDLWAVSQRSYRLLID